MEKDHWYEIKIRVRYKDTDRMGVVYYGNYLTFFEMARTEYMRDMGFPYSRLEASGYYLVVTETAAKYHANVGYDSLITVKSTMTPLGRIRVRFDYEAVDENGGRLVSGYTVHACMNANQKPARLPDDLKKIIHERTGSNSMETEK